MMYLCMHDVPIVHVYIYIYTRAYTPMCMYTYGTCIIGIHNTHDPGTYDHRYL